MTFIWRKNKKSYFDFFEEHAQHTYEAAILLDQLFMGQEFAAGKEIARKIKLHEHHADQVAHSIYNQLNSSGFILPIDREDILFLVKTLDDVIDFIKDSAEAFTEIYELKETTPFAKKLTKEILSGVEILLTTCSLLRKPSQNNEAILKKCIEIHRIENEGDDLKKIALHNLFSQMKNNEISFANYIAWNDIYCLLEAVTDRIEDFANAAEQFVMKYS